MTQMHPIEAAWRQFRNSENRSLLNECLALLDSSPAPPSHVVLPQDIPWKITAQRLGLADGMPVGYYVEHFRETGTLADIDTVHIWAAYRQSKTIYEIDPRLVDCLARSGWPAETPTQALRLPSLCPVLQIEHAGRVQYVAVAYDLAPQGDGTLDLLLRAFRRAGEWAPEVEAVVDKDYWLPMSTLHLTECTLSQCIGAAVKEAYDDTPIPNPAQNIADWSTDLVGLTLTLLLYLGGEPDIVRLVHPGQKPLKPKIARTEPERYQDLREPTVHAVGRTFAHAIERWEIEHRHDESVDTGKTVRPHMRRAHSHLYWTGEGRKQARVKFLLPIGVRGGRAVEEPQEPLITPTR